MPSTPTPTSGARSASATTAASCGPIRRLVLALVVALLLGGCGRAGDAPASGTAPTDRDVAITTTTTHPTSPEVPARPGALVARPSHPVDVHQLPDAAGPPVLRLESTTEFGSPRVLAVLDERDGWLHVALPERPNGSTGWILAAGVELHRTPLTIRIDLAGRTLEVADADHTVLSAPVAVGAPSTPTPTGTFYVVDKLATPDPSSSYGPFALGISAHSDVHTEFAGGDGQIGIHGTNAPGSIGQPVSNGCIRVANDVVTTLADLVDLGTPVIIT